jgi:hypothetical protein
MPRKATKSTGKSASISLLDSGQLLRRLGRCCVIGCPSSAKNTASATYGFSALTCEASSIGAAILMLLVEFEEVPTLPRLISLERKLHDIIGIKVDLVSIGELKGETGERILQEKVQL